MKRPAVRVNFYDESQERDEAGRWTKSPVGTHYAARIEKAHAPTLVQRIRDWFAKQHADREESDRKFHEFFDHIAPGASLSEWREDEHPRDDDGKFTSAGGSYGADDAKQRPPAKVTDYRLVRDARGTPLSHELSGMGAYKPQAAPPWADPKKHAAIQERLAARAKVGRQLDPSLHVEQGPERPGEGLHRETAYDTPEVMRARAQIRAFEKRWKAENGFDLMSADGTSAIKTPQRQKLRRDIARDLYGHGSAEKGRKAMIVTGPPGSGKSTYVEKDLGRGDWLTIDPDEAKEQLPEFNAGMGANLVHEESTRLFNDVLERAMESGDNVVLPRVGKNLKDLHDLVAGLQAKGYDVELHNIDMDPEKSAESCAVRFHQTNRFVPPEYALEVGRRPREVHEQLKGILRNVAFKDLDSDELFAARRKK